MGAIFLWITVLSLSDLPGPDGGLLTCVEVTDVAGRINNQLKLRHNCGGGNRTLLQFLLLFFVLYYRMLFLHFYTRKIYRIILTALDVE